MSDLQLMVYQFRRANVERGDFSDFWRSFRDRLPSGAALAELLGGLAFTVDGYDDDPREIYVIPEVRRFYAAFHRAWPHWLYFCDLDQDGLKTMVMCCLPSLAAVAQDGRPLVGVQLKPTELVRFIADDFGPMVPRYWFLATFSGWDYQPQRGP